jgi:drug/metabolite transporter, DME family
MPRDRDLLAGTLAAIIGASLFGTLGPLSRFGAEAGMDGVAFTAWRALLGVGLLAGLIATRRRAGSSVSAIRGLNAAGRVALVVASLMGLVLNAAMFTAFGLIPIALALMLFYTYPAGVTLVDLATGRERLSAPRVAALALSSAGVVLVLLGSMDTSTGLALDAMGIVLGLGAAVCQVVFVSVSRTGYRSVPADAATLIILATSMVGAFAIALIGGQGAGLVTPFRDPGIWPVLLAAGILAAGVSSVLFLSAIRLIGGTRTGILMLIEPVVGVLLAALWLGEQLAPVQVLGGALVLAGATLLQLRSEPEHLPVVEAGASPVV